MIALMVVVLGGVFALPLYASTGQVAPIADVWEYPDVKENAHNFVFFRPQRVVVPDVNGNTGTGTIMQNYTTVNKHWDTINSNEFNVNITAGTPVTYQIEMVKVEEYKSGAYRGYLELTFWIEGYKTESLSTYVIEETQVNRLPTGYSTRLNGNVIDFTPSEGNDDIYMGAGGISWRREYTASRSYTCEWGKGCVFTIYLYQPSVGWLMFEEPVKDEDVIRDLIAEMKDYLGTTIGVDVEQNVLSINNMMERIWDLTGEYMNVIVVLLTIALTAVCFRGLK